MTARLNIVLVGIAGTPDDFLLSPYALKAWLATNPAIRDGAEIEVLSYPFVPAGEQAEAAERILRDMRARAPRLVGLACYLWNREVVDRLAAGLKAQRPDTLVALGGPEISEEEIRAGKFNGSPADFLVFGEGEKPLEALVLHLLGARPGVVGVRGLARREGGAFATCGADAIGQLDRVPSPYLSGAIPDELLARPGIRANVESQRGCNFRCAYCFYHKDFRGIRYRDPTAVAEEMALVAGRGIRMCRITDANFISDREHAGTILRGIIGRRLRLSLFAEILPQFVDEELAGLFGEYVRCAPGNALMLGIGLQTVHEESLRAIRRAIPLRHFERAFDLLAGQGAILKTDLILGLPRETRESYFRTIEFIAEKLRRGTHFLSLAVLRVLPGSDMAEIARRENLTPDTRDAGRFVYETPTLPRADMLECLRLNAAAFRVLSTVHMEQGPRIRDLYFETKDRLGVTHVRLLRRLAGLFFDYLRERNTDFVKPDFPNAEDYASKDIRRDIPDDWLAGQLVRLGEAGLADGEG